MVDLSVRRAAGWSTDSRTRARLDRPKRGARQQVNGIVVTRWGA